MNITAPEQSEVETTPLGDVPSGPRYGASSGLLIKIVSLGLLNALVLAGMPRLLSKPDYPIAIAAIVALVVIDIVYLSKRFVPAKYLIPGTIFLLVFALYPVLYLVYISTTNFGTGNNLTKDQAIERIEANSVVATEDAPRYELQILAAGNDATTGELAFLLTDEAGNRFLGTADDFVELSDDQIIEDGRRETVDGFGALNLGAANDRAAEISAFVVTGPTGEIDNEGFTDAFAKVQSRVYDAATDTLFDAATDTVFTIEEGYFVDGEGTRLLPGWRANIGLDNYERLANDDQTRNVFLRVFAWTILFSLFSVLLSFGLGLGLAMVFNDERMRGRKIYRSLIIIPYAIPSFMTALVWKGMLNEQFGIVNRWFGSVFDLVPGMDASPPWLDGQWLPYGSILLVNTWLGYPYMFLVCSGALQSIPKDLTEAASVDGATGIKRFRRITFPLLLVAVAPLLVASFAFNFNNFNLIFLLTEGRPPVQGSDAGRTDILISYVYEIAFSSGGGADYGFASAVSLIIFLIVAAISTVSFRFTKSFEELR